MTTDAKSGSGLPINIRALRAFSPWRVEDSERLTPGEKILQMWNCSLGCKRLTGGGCVCVSL